MSTNTRTPISLVATNIITWHFMAENRGNSPYPNLKKKRTRTFNRKFKLHPSLLYITMIKHYSQKQLEEERVFLTSHSPSSGEAKAGTQRQETRDKKWSSDHREKLLTGLLQMAFSAYFIIAPRLCPPIVAYRQSDGGIFLTEICFSLMTLICVKLTKLSSTAEDIAQRMCLAG